MVERLPVPRRVCTTPAVTVCASFNRFIKETGEAIQELKEEGARVLSPQKPHPHSELEGDFLLLAGDMQFPHTSVKQVEDRHLACINRSDFVWLVCPGGYVGISVAMELGFALGLGIPIYSLYWPTLEDKILKDVYIVQNIRQAVLNHSTPKI